MEVKDVLHMSAGNGETSYAKNSGLQSYSRIISIQDLSLIESNTMEVKDVLHMSAGNGETSYANNSDLQKVVLSKTWPVLDETFKHMFTDNNGFPKCTRIADLGCSSGPNILFLISHIIDAIQHFCKNNNLTHLPQLELLLNDLPHNDFNNLFKLVSDFRAKNYKERNLKCFIYGAPGSFYATLFPSNSIHFVYSSFSIHWLSQVPEGLGNNNKDNIYITTDSSPQVCEAYANQFQRDFSKFMSWRAEELTSGGRMVLAFIGRSLTNPSSIDENSCYTILAQALSDMVSWGFIKKDDLHSFNLPLYTPCLQEIRTIISDEGSFNLDNMEVVSVPWDAHNGYNDKIFDKRESAELVAGCIRAVMEPLLVSHFGSSIVDDVFDIYAKKMEVHLSKEKSSYFTPVISLTRKLK